MDVFPPFEDLAAVPGSDKRIKGGAMKASKFVREGNPTIEPYLHLESRV